MRKNYPIRLTTITPVCIGTGQKLSPYADYIIDEDSKKIFYIDQALVKRKIAEKLNLIDEYVHGVSTGMDNNRSRFNLYQFLKDKLNIDVYTQHQLQLDCEAQGNKELCTIIKNAGIYPYIPGSSIKGAIKTALLYDWIINSKDGRSWLQRFVSALLQNRDDKEMWTKLENELEQALSLFERLHVTDSTQLNDDDMIVIETKRIHIGTGELTIPQVWEAILEEKQIEFHLGIPYTNLSLVDLIECINRFSQDNNQKELMLLNKFGTVFKDKYPEDYTDLVTFYEQINYDIQQSQNKTAYLRIGSGKGYYFNSIAVAVANYKEGKYFSAFLIKYGKGYKFKNPHKFPVTRPIDMSSFKPLGWVKFEVID